jgi:hypothetical protein
VRARARVCEILVAYMPMYIFAGQVCHADILFVTLRCPCNEISYMSLKTLDVLNNADVGLVASNAMWTCRCVGGYQRFGGT